MIPIDVYCFLIILNKFPLIACLFYTILYFPILQWVLSMGDLDVPTQNGPVGDLQHVVQAQEFCRSHRRPPASEAPLHSAYVASITGVENEKAWFLHKDIEYVVLNLHASLFAMC